jgi:hypothetical protein
MLRLFVAPVVEAFDYQHPKDHLYGCGVSPEPPRVGVALGKVGFHYGEELIVLEQSIELSKLRFELKLELGDQLEEVYDWRATHRSTRSWSGAGGRCWCVAGRKTLGSLKTLCRRSLTRSSGRSLRCQVKLRTIPRPQPIGASGILLGKVGYILGQVGCTRG